MATMMTKGSLQDMVKAAMAGTLNKVDVSAEAARQSVNHGQEAEKSAATSQNEGHIPTEQVVKLASALDYIADGIVKEGATGQKTSITQTPQMPGKGPQALEVLQAQSSEKNIDTSGLGQATSKHVNPTSPPMQASPVQKSAPTNAMQDNTGMQHAEQPTDPWANEKAPLQQGDQTKAAAYVRDLQAKMLGKTPEQREQIKQASAEPKNFQQYLRALQKHAEDDNNPSNISAGAASAVGAPPPPLASASEEKVPSQPPDVSKQESLVGSNQSAINYTKQQAKADPKKDVNKVLTEPALSKSTDPVLQNTLDHASSAGVKISSAQKMRDSAVQVAGARALLSKLAAEVCSEKERKEKKGAMGATPQSAAGPAASPPPSMGGGGAPATPGGAAGTARV